MLKLIEAAWRAESYRRGAKICGGGLNNGESQHGEICKREKETECIEKYKVT